MKNYRRTAGLSTLALLLAGYYTMPSTVKAAETGDSARITELFADAKAEAVELKLDSADMEQFTYSNMTYVSYATKVAMIKGHVNNTGKLLAKMKEAEATGSPWQQTAIKRIEPLLMELAESTTATIEYLNANQQKVHFPEFKDYVRANYEIAVDLEALIRDFVNYGESKERFERLGEKLELNS